MAHSTWFQGSMWPPGVHGMAPDGSWAAAIVPAVARTMSASSSPGSSGRSGRRIGGDLRRRRFDRVDDQALAEERIERVLDRAGKPRALHDVPDQHPVVGANDRAAFAERAVEPPVR